MFKHLLGTIAVLVFSIGFSSDANATSSWYCETGDPTGAGPIANVDIDKSGVYTLSVNYNRRDLQAFTRPTTLNFMGRPISTTTSYDGAYDCIRSTLDLRGKRSIEFSICGNGEYATIKLFAFTRIDPEFEMACQSN